MALITAKIAEARPLCGQKSGYLRVECSDGHTYYRVTDMFRGKPRHSYGVWPTNSREIDKPIARGKMPSAVRNAMRFNPVVVTEPEMA